MHFHSRYAAIAASVALTAALVSGTAASASADDASTLLAQGTTTTGAATNLSLALSSGVVTYGDGVTLSGSLTKTNAQTEAERGVNSAGISLAYSALGCDDTSATAIGTAVTSTGQTAGDWSWPTPGAWRQIAGSWSVTAAYAGRGGPDDAALAPSHACQQLAVDKAPTDTSLVGTPAASLGLGSSLDVGYLVDSAHGIGGNYAGGTVSLQQTSQGSGLCSTGEGEVAVHALQSDADGTGTGFSTTGTLTCTPTAVGAYTYRLTYSGDDNYLGSSSTPDSVLSVTDVTVQVCKAAPAIAGDYLRAHNVKAGSTTWKAVIPDVARQTGSKGDFFAKQACDDDYATKVAGYISSAYHI